MTRKQLHVSYVDANRSPAPTLMVLLAHDTQKRRLSWQSSSPGVSASARVLPWILSLIRILECRNKIMQAYVNQCELL